MIGTIQQAIDAAASSERAVKILTSYANALEQAVFDMCTAEIIYADTARDECARLAIEANQPRVASLRVALEHDNDVEDPTTHDQAWSVASFNRRHIANKNRSAFEGIGWVRKFQAGTAFLLHYTEHGQCDWYASDWTEASDLNHADGVVFYRGDPADLPKGFDARRADVTRFMQCYTDWCNGHGFGYRIVAIDDIGDEEEDGSCWGFYGSDADYACEDAAATLAAALDKHGLNEDAVSFVGDLNHYGDKVMRALKKLRAEQADGAESNAVR